MLTDQTNARIVGMLFIVASAAAALSQVMLGPLLDDEEYLTALAGDASQVRIGALLDLVTAAAVVAIPVMLFPILRRHDETTSVGYLSIWGLVGAPLMLAAGLLGMFGHDPFSTASVVLAAPLAVNEMVLAVWLIVKGFNPSAARREARTR